MLEMAGNGWKCWENYDERNRMRIMMRIIIGVMMTIRMTIMMR